MKGLGHCFRRVFLRETKRIFSRPIYIVCSVVAPLACYILFSTLMEEGLPVELPVAVVDADNTATTRKITRNLDALQQVDIVARYANTNKATTRMRQGKIYAFYYFPEHTTAKLFGNRQPTVSFYMNYSYLAAGSLTYRDMYITSLLANASIGNASLAARGVSQEAAKAFLQPIVIETHAIGNPWISYAIYLNNTLFPGILSLLIFLLTAFGITLEIKHRTARKWLRLAGNNITVALLGKLLPMNIIFSLTAICYNVYLYRFLHFPVHDGIWSMIAASLLLVTASQAFGVFLAAMLPSPRWAMSVASLWGVVSFSISGFSFPIEGMSHEIQTVTNLFPLRHYFMIYCNQALLGYPIGYAALHYAALFAFCLLPMFFLRRLKESLLKYPYIE